MLSGFLTQPKFIMDEVASAGSRELMSDIDSKTREVFRETVAINTVTDFTNSGLSHSSSRQLEPERLSSINGLLIDDRTYDNM